MSASQDPDMLIDTPRESLNINFIDFEEYPASGEIETRCVNM